MKFGIIGFGRFGQLWTKVLAAFGEVLVYDRKQFAADNILQATLKEVTQTDILFLLVPISEFEQCCNEIKDLLHPDTLVVDCCSVKVYPAEIMQQVFLKTQPLLATHPLFGPDSVKKNGGLANHSIVLCPIGSPPPQQKLLEDIFKQLKLNILKTTPDDHDKQMANSQALIHFIGRSLQVLDLKPQELATPDFQAMIDINHRVIHDSWQLFFDMHHYNPYTKAMRNKIIQQLIQLDHAIEKTQIEDTPNPIKQLREQIEKIDASIIQQLATRQKLVKQIGDVKLKNHREIKDAEREAQLMRYYENLSQQYNLDAAFVKSIFDAIISHSREIQIR